MTSKAAFAGNPTIINEAASLATDLFEEARTSLAVSVRFLDIALWRMPLVQSTLPCACATDGYAFYYDPVRAISQFKVSSDETVRDYLHAILHCVFHHPFEPARPDADLWDLACDIAVESTAMELARLRYPSDLDIERTRALTRLSELCPQLTAVKIYHAMAGVPDIDGVCGKPVVPKSLIETMGELFARDGHGVWTRTAESRERHAKVDAESTVAPFESKIHLKGNGPHDEGEDDLRDGSAYVDGDPADSHGGSAMEAAIEEGDRFITATSPNDGASEIKSMSDTECSNDFADIDWKDISSMIGAELDGYVGKFGTDAGSFSVNLSVANRKTCDFRTFLKRFSALSEEMKISTEEFDYVYYTYGLSLYRNMPLVEPLEYEETRRVREFAIAIDTSASCAGSFIQRFVEKTYDILKSTGTFGRKINVHILQCDSDIRKDTKVTETSGIDETFAEYQGRGFGGTDFRPVFKYVNELIESREFKNLKGLVYLTDGIGTFPEEEPGYQTAFVFVDEQAAQRPVPPWAMKVLMAEDDIIELLQQP